MVQLIKGYSRLLDCEVWRLQQFSCGKWFTCEAFSVFTTYHYAPEGGAERNHVANRVRERRYAIRQAIADYQQEQRA